LPIAPKEISQMFQGITDVLFAWRTRDGRLAFRRAPRRRPWVPRWEGPLETRLVLSPGGLNWGKIEVSVRPDDVKDAAKLRREFDEMVRRAQRIPYFKEEFDRISTVDPIKIILSLRPILSLAGKRHVGDEYATNEVFLKDIEEFRPEADTKNGALTQEEVIFHILEERAQEVEWAAKGELPNRDRDHKFALEMQNVYRSKLPHPKVRLKVDESSGSNLYLFEDGSWEDVVPAFGSGKLLYYKPEYHPVKKTSRRPREAPLKGDFVGGYTMDAYVYDGTSYQLRHMPSAGSIEVDITSVTGVRNIHGQFYEAKISGTFTITNFAGRTFSTKFTGQELGQIYFVGILGPTPVIELNSNSDGPFRVSLRGWYAGGRINTSDDSISLQYDHDKTQIGAYSSAKTVELIA
jgi:hypothetical protein